MLKRIFYGMYIFIIGIFVFAYFLLHTNGDDVVESSPSFLYKSVEDYEVKKENYPSFNEYLTVKEKAKTENYKRLYDDRIERISKEYKIKKGKERKAKLASKKKKEEEQLKLLAEKKEKVEGGGNWKTFEVTAYTAGVESTGKSSSHPNYGLTASGKYVQRYATIACPPSMEFGTRIYIPKMNNTYTCHDRGSDIVSGRLDIYMKHLSDAQSFGRKVMKVKILN